MDEPQIRICLKGRTPITVPEICPVTGTSGHETHIVRAFGFHFTFWETTQIPLRFSEDGWAQFQRTFPYSVRVYQAGVNIALYVPLLGGLVAILWLLAALLPCSVIAILDFVQKRRGPLVRLRRLVIQHADVRAIDISVASQRFAEEFVRLNTSLSLDQYLRELKRKKFIRTTVIGLPALAGAVLLLIGELMLVDKWPAMSKPIVVAGCVCLIAALLANDLTGRLRWIKSGRIE